MSLTIKLISETYLRENTPLNQNIDIKDILPNIVPAQDLFLQSILGTDLLTTIQLAYSAQTLTANEITLMEYIKPVVAYRAAELSLPFIQFQIKNKGVVQMNGDNLVETNKDILVYMRNELVNRAEFYSQRLVEYLCNNSTLYPTYSTNTGSDVQPTAAPQYFSPIIFDNNNFINRPYFYYNN